MSIDALAGWTLVVYAAVLLLIVLWRAWRSPLGWELWLLYAIAALYCRLCFHWRSNRTCPFDQEPRALIIANHRSPIDPMLIWIGIRNYRPLEFLTAQEYFGIRGLQFIFTHLRAIPVARDGKDMAATRTALRRLKDSCLLGVFPEGGITVTPGLRPGNPGVAWLALQSQAPVYPVYIHNAPQSSSMVEPFLKFQRVRVSYGDQVDLAPYRGKRATPEVLQEVTDLLMARLAGLGGIAPPVSQAPQRQLPDAGRTAADQ